MSNSKKINLGCWMLMLLFGLNGNLILGQVKKMAFDKYGVAEGLPEEYVSDVIQDDKGFIWLSTQNGLVKYDGYKFHVFKKSIHENDTNGLQFSSIVGGLIKSRDGKIWMGADNHELQIASFDPVLGKFKSYKYSIKEESGNSINQLALLFLEDSKGNIWFQRLRSKTEQIGRLDPSSGQIKLYSVAASLFNQRTGSIVEKNDILWIVDNAGQFMKWNAQNDEFESIVSEDISNTLTQSGDKIQRLFAGNQNRILLTGRKNLFVYDAESKKLITTYNQQMENPSDDITGAREDKNGHIWVTFHNGAIARIDPQVNKIRLYTAGEDIPLETNQNTRNYDYKIVDLNDDGIWFEAIRYYSFSERLTAYFPAQYVFYDFQTDDFDLYDIKFNLHTNHESMNGLFKFFRDKTDLLWLAAQPNLYKNSPRNIQLDWYRHEKAKDYGLPCDTITSLFEDSKGRLWVGTDNGLGLYNSETDDFLMYKEESSKSNSLSSNLIKAIVEDAYGNIWIGTQNGLNRWNEDSRNFQRYFYEHKSLSEGTLPSIITIVKSDAQNRLWVCIWNKGVFAMDPISGKVINGYSAEDNYAKGLTSKEIVTIFQDSRGNIWFGDPGEGEFGLYKLGFNEDKFVHYKSAAGHASEMAGNNKLSLGGHPEANVTSGISSNEIHFVNEDSKGNLWVGTDDGLNLYDYKTDKFKVIDDRNNWSVSAMTEDKYGRLWFATYAGEGLLQVNPEDLSFKSFGEKLGLLHNDLVFVSAEITQDNSGRFWLPNQRGLSVFDPETSTYKNYFSKDGFQSYNLVYNVIKTKDGNIWIGGRSGLNRIVPEQLQQRDESLPSVVITDITINGVLYNNPDGDIFEKSVPYTQEIRLSHLQKDLQFDFVSLHFLRSEDNLYSWKLENYDEEWSEPSRNRSIGYTNLSPGTYVFKVKGSNGDGVWNEIPTAITITILPPWWRTWGAYLGYIFAFIGTVVGFSYWRADALRKKNALLEEKVNTRTVELAAKTSDLESSLNELKSAQSQLIHAEKMASLGELTAGIAHEIQNPLNFVNNFSEVSNELIDEMNLELDKGDIKGAKALAVDVKENLEKIHHHGKRADSIVKGMLQHSRSSTGHRESTALNALCDEYLRLSYHGLRAKDASFNATMKTDFDSAVGNVHVMPQELGRVLLNLYNNAFYAVNEKKRAGIEGYVPTVTVSSKRIGNKIELKIADNGNGIPGRVIEKIFQPFFTTKPAGQGTGLGLSLSYDIITKGHGGELKVETKEYEGSVFIIVLPVNTA